MQSTQQNAPAIVDLPHERRAPWVLGGALVFGALTQALFWNAGLGANWLVWDVAMVSVTVALLRRSRLKPTAIAAITACLLFGVALVLHRSMFTTAVALPCNLVALALLPIVIGDDLGFDDLATLPTRMLAALGRTPSSIARTVLLPSDAVAVLDVRGRGVAKGAIAGLVLGVPAAGFFALLLAADPGFASALGQVHARLGAAATFAAYAAITAVIYAFAHAVYVHTRRTDGDQRTIDVAAPYRALEPSFSIASFVSPLTWGLVIGQVAAVFGVFVVVHADTEFGGHAVVRERSWLTYSGHLHAGFYQLMLATVLSVCLVLVGHALMRARLTATGSQSHAEGAPRAVPGGSILSALESALLVLTGLTLVSCAQRLKLYEEAYGATHLRLGVAFVGIAVFGLLLCTLAKALFRSFRGFAGAALATLTACAIAASMFDADGYVAHANLDRVARGAELDEAYLSTLSADACTQADHPALADRELRARLLRAWASHGTTDDPRAFRGLTRCPESASP